MFTRGKGARWLAGLGLMVVLAGSASAAQAAGTPGTDLFASTIAPLTGGTSRVCATSGSGVPVHCVDRAAVLPSASPSATGVTFGHWVFCKQVVCGGGLLRHELVHVGQFEQYGDLFGPMYLLEAGLHGTSCANKWERPAYQVNGGC